jgi:hypothetical protein
MAVIGGSTNNSGNNLNGGLNFVLVGSGSADSGNNTGGGLNIAIVGPNSTGVGNCASSLCVNIFGVQLLDIGGSQLFGAAPVAVARGQQRPH